MDAAAMAMAIVFALFLLNDSADALRHTSEPGEVEPPARCIAEKGDDVRFLMEFAEKEFDGRPSLSSRISFAYFGLDPQWVLTRYVALPLGFGMEFARRYVSERCSTASTAAVVADEQVYDLLREVVLSFAAEPDTCQADFGEVRVEFLYRCFQGENQVRAVVNDGTTLSFSAPSISSCRSASEDWYCDIESVRAFLYRKWDEMMVVRPKPEMQRMTKRTQDLFDCKYRLYRDCVAPAFLRNLLVSRLTTLDAPNPSGKLFRPAASDVPEADDAEVIRNSREKQRLMYNDIADAALLAVVPTYFLPSTSIFRKMQGLLAHERAASSVARAA
mmetsp:Transcript_126761/g.354962  ORF Transcript_126761/g.354962 Transcript_126761/m.354962 type:complete len:331 (+) Transcript_126761:83-1075(+)